MIARPECHACFVLDLHALPDWRASLYNFFPNVASCSACDLWCFVGSCQIPLANIQSLQSRRVAAAQTSIPAPKETNIFKLFSRISASDISLQMTDTQKISLQHAFKCSHLQSRCEKNTASVHSLCESSVLGKDPVGWPWLSQASTLFEGPAWM